MLPTRSRMPKLYWCTGDARVLNSLPFCRCSCRPEGVPSCWPPFRWQVAFADRCKCLGGPRAYWRLYRCRLMGRLFAPKLPANITPKPEQLIPKTIRLERFKSDSESKKVPTVDADYVSKMRRQVFSCKAFQRRSKVTSSACASDNY